MTPEQRNERRRRDGDRVETWKLVVGYDGLYEVSDLGAVRSLGRRVQSKGGHRVAGGRLLRPTLTPPGNYYTVCLRAVGRKKRTKTIHSLVAEAFLGPRPSGMVVCHKDGNAANNVLGNLRYDTPAANEADKLAHGRVRFGERSHLAKLTDQQVLLIRENKEGLSQRNLAKSLGVKQSTISNIVTGRGWRHVTEDQSRWAFINGMEAVVRRYQRREEAEVDQLINRMRKEEEPRNAKRNQRADGQGNRSTIQNGYEREADRPDTRPNRH